MTPEQHPSLRELQGSYTDPESPNNIPHQLIANVSPAILDRAVGDDRHPHVVAGIIEPAEAEWGIQRADAMIENAVSALNFPAARVGQAIKAKNEGRAVVAEAKAAATRESYELALAVEHEQIRLSAPVRWGAAAAVATVVGLGIGGMAHVQMDAASQQRVEQTQESDAVVHAELTQGTKNAMVGLPTIVGAGFGAMSGAFALYLQGKGSRAAHWRAQRMARSKTDK